MWSTPDEWAHADERDDPFDPFADASSDSVPADLFDPFAADSAGLAVAAPAPGPVQPARPAAKRQPRSTPVETSERRARVAPWVWGTFAAAAVGAAGVGFTLFSMVASLRIRMEAAADLSGWSTGFLIAALVCLVALFASVVALFRERQRLVPTLALLIVLFVTPWSAFMGAKLGIEAVSAQVGDDVAALLDNAGVAGSIVDLILGLEG